MSETRSLADRLRLILRDRGARGDASPAPAPYAGLHGLLQAQDGPSMQAVLLGRAAALADALGLKEARRLLLPEPDFSLDNLALAAGRCDVIVSAAAIGRSTLTDAANETLRVLKPGGVFLHAAPTTLMTALTGIQEPDGQATALRNAFSDAVQVVSGQTWLPEAWAGRGGHHGAHVWVAGRGPRTPQERTPSAVTRSATPTGYRFTPTPAKLGVVACVRNEAPYLLEWIAYHRVIGFDRVIIYDNESNDSTSRLLAPLAEAGVIHAVYWPTRPRKSKQISAYNDAITRLDGVVEWCAFLDLDEFLVPDENTAMMDLVPTAAGVSAVGLPWRIFGSGGEKVRDPRLTIERFRMAAATNNQHVKSLVRVSDVRYMNIHVPDLKRGRIVDLAGETIDYQTLGRIGRIVSGPARVNHYFCRSLEEFEFKRLRGRGGVTPESPKQFRQPSMFDAMDLNDVEIVDALRFAPAVRNELARLRTLLDV